MTRFSTCLILLLYSFSSHSQSLDTKIEAFLKKESIDSFLIYSYPCIGYQEISDTCSARNERYLLWIKNNRYYIKQYKECNISTSVILKSNNPLDFYINNKQIIDTEIIKPPEHYEYQKNKAGFDTLFVRISVDHSCFHTFRFSLGNQIVNKSADIFDLNYPKFDNGEKNINYDYNEATKFKALIDQLLTLTEYLKKIPNGTFR